MKTFKMMPFLIIVLVLAFFVIKSSSDPIAPLSSEALYINSLTDSGYEYATFSAG